MLYITTGKLETTIMTLISPVSNNDILMESWKRPNLFFSKFLGSTRK